MQVDTGSFQALSEQVAALETEVAQLQRTVVLREVFIDEIENRAYQRGRESILGTRATSVSPRTRHLQVVSGGAR